MAILGSSSVLMNATEIQLFLFSSREKGSGGGGDPEVADDCINKLEFVCCLLTLYAPSSP